MDRTRWGIVALLFAAGLLAAMQFAKASLTLDLLAVRYPGAPVAFLVSAVAVMGVAFGVLAGAIVARTGPRRAILAAVAASAALSLAEASLPGFGVLMALRALEGAGHLALVVALPTLMAGAASRADRPVVMGLWGTFFGVGFALTALAIPPLVRAGGAGAVFAAHGALLVAIWPALWLCLPRGDGGAASLAGPVAAHRAVYGAARRIAPGAGHGLYTSLFIALVAILPGALGAAWLAPVLPLANLAGTFCAGVMARRIAPGRLVAWGFAASAALFAGMLAAGPAAPWAALAAMAATGVVAGAGFAAVPALNEGQADQARANGAMAQLGNVGTFSGTPLLIAATAAGGAEALLLSAAAICALGAIVTAVLYGRAARSAR